MAQVDCHVEPAVDADEAAVQDALRARMAREPDCRLVLVRTRQLGIGDRRLQASRQRLPRACAWVCERDLHCTAEELAPWVSAGLRAAWVRPASGCMLDAQLHACHILLPPALHIELRTGTAELARKAPLLARWPRMIVGVLGREDSPATTCEAERLSWWGDMGNLYLKLVGAAAWARHSDLLAQFPPDRVLWGSGTLGTDTPDAGPGMERQEALDYNAARLYGL